MAVFLAVPTHLFILRCKFMGKVRFLHFPVSVADKLGDNMNISKEIYGKWINKNEEKDKKTGYVIFGSHNRIKSRSFIYEGVSMGFYYLLDERESKFFLCIAGVCIAANMSVSEDILTIVTSDDTVHEYIKSPDKLPITMEFYNAIIITVNFLVFAGIVAFIIIILLHL